MVACCFASRYLLFIISQVSRIYRLRLVSSCSFIIQIIGKVYMHHFCTQSDCTCMEVLDTHWVGMFFLVAGLLLIVSANPKRRTHLWLVVYKFLNNHQISLKLKCLFLIGLYFLLSWCLLPTQCQLFILLSCLISKPIKESAVSLH